MAGTAGPVVENSLSALDDQWPLPRRRQHRPFPAAVALFVVIAACGGSTSSTGPRPQPLPTALPQVTSSKAEAVPSALDDPRAFGLPQPLVDPSQIRPGGPPPDGIPPIDQPRFLEAKDVSFLADREPVVAIEIAGEARAYPVQIMTWHEIVNDTVGGIPVTVSYCPLCNSAIAYDRRAAGRVLDFGTSGMLYQSALVMYDRQTQSLWSHFTAQAIAGVLTGTRLEVYPMATVSWADWRRAHPSGWVLSRDTGHSRRYGTNPYAGYDDPSTQPFLFAGSPDPRLPAKERVIGLARGDAAVAVVAAGLLETRVVEVALGNQPTVVWMKPGTASALDTNAIAEGRDVGAAGAFDPVINGQHLHFTTDGEGFRDAETGSQWDVLGRGTGGALAGRQLRSVAHVDTFWFAWAAFQPATEIVRPGN